MRQRKRAGWVLNREFFIAMPEGIRPIDLRNIEDRAAVREFVAHAARHPVTRRVLDRG